MAACVPVTGLPGHSPDSQTTPPSVLLSDPDLGPVSTWPSPPGLVLPLVCICLPSGWLGATHHHSPLCRPQLASLGVAASAPACAWAAAPQGQLLMGLHVPSRPLAHLHAPRGLVGVLLSTSHPVHQLIACCVMGLLVGPPHRWLCDGPPGPPTQLVP